jgi:hypothetical protein
MRNLQKSVRTRSGLRRFNFAAGRLRADLSHHRNDREPGKEHAMQSTRIAAALAAALCLAGGPAAAQTARSAIGLGAGAHPLGSAAPVLQFEVLLNDRVSVGARAVGLEYTYEDESYTETGSGRGAEALVAYHFQGQGHAGPYIAGGLGYFSVEWDWADPRASGVRSGFGRTRGGAVSATLGWKFPFGRSFYVDPSITLGHFFGTAKDNSGTRESELSSYGALVVKLGMRF